jgi:cytochrome c biogenesis protein CcmG/thiol:disulfide interchange protein DsbE
MSRRFGFAEAAAVALVVALLTLLVYHLVNSSAASPGTLRLPVIWQSQGVRTLALQRLRGRPVVVNFWASWCGPCTREAPLLRHAAAQTRGRVVFIGIDMHDSTTDARSFLRRHDIRYTVVRGNDQLVNGYGVIGLPETLYLDAHGNVVARTVGELTARALTTNLTRLTD